MTYVEALKDLAAAEYVIFLLTTGQDLIQKIRVGYGAITTVQFQSYTPADFVVNGSLSQDQRTMSRVREAEQKAALQKLQLAINVTNDIERRMGIMERWTPECNQYKSASAYLNNHQFIHAVDKLEGLVVQQLFELSKSHLAGTGIHHYILVAWIQLMSLI